MDEKTWTPLIISAVTFPSPAVSGQPFLLSVAAIDVFGAEQLETYIIGEFISGEV